MCIYIYKNHKAANGKGMVFVPINRVLPRIIIPTEREPFRITYFSSFVSLFDTQTESEESFIFPVK